MAELGKPETDVILAEYKSVREEILQLNRQLFAAIGSSLALNVAILGWLFNKPAPQEFYPLPTIGILVLFVGNATLLNRNRLAHRLALFQQYCIEPRLQDIIGGRVYFKYRDYYDKYQQGWWARWGERLADSGTYVFFSASLVNIAILLLFGLIPWWDSGSTEIDVRQMINVIIAIVLAVAQLWFLEFMTNYRPVRVLMRRAGVVVRRAAQKSGIPGAGSSQH